MKRQAFLALILILTWINIDLSAKTKNDKILVAYFSWSGNAKAIAGQIAKETGGDLFEIKTVTPYSDNYDECVAVARQELESNARPAIAGKVENMEQYTTIFLCYPNWCNTLPMAVFTFLEAYDFSAKTIYPLVTYGSGHFGKSLDDIRKLVPKAVIGEGLSVGARSKDPSSIVVSIPNKDVTSWIHKTLKSKGAGK